MTLTQVAAPTAGFTTLETETAIADLPVRGEIPDWLHGSLVRPGPAKFEIGTQQLRHWFDGLTMVHRFSIEQGRVSYANRFLEGRTYRAAKEQGRIAYPEFATDPCRTLFQRMQSKFSPGFGDNANINMVKLGERFISMTETPISVQFDPDTLAAAGVAYEAPGHLTTAHPHGDRSDGAALNYAARLGPRSEYRFYRVPADGGEPQVILSKGGVREPAYMHSFGLTERWFVLAEFPLVVNPLRLAMSGRPYIENYRWKPELGTRFTLLDRRTGEAVGPFTAPPFFAFHHVNAYEEGDEVVVDISAYPDAKIIEDLYLDRLRAGAPVTPPHLRRFRLDLHDLSVRDEQLVESSFELPRINYGRCNERPYRYTWGVGAGRPDVLADRIVKIDVEERTAHEWHEAGGFPGEPVFVAAREAQAEDEGVLLSVVLDAERETSFLLVLDAQTLAELARAEVPHHIPFGFHGQFARA